jgi:hypothetical protein|tara:strand:- start:63 stop:413 length:351 start_codon:yes stop_codon:yes gene_type:complete
MAINYTWSITGLKLEATSSAGLNDVVTGIKFNYTGTDENGVSSSFAGAVPVGAPDADTFTAYGTLTEADIITWAQANHPVDHMQEVVTKGIQKLTVVETDATTLPWEPEPEEVTPE